MPGETADWGRLNAETIVFPVTDLGELAVRLGSIDRYDRRGDVIDLASFEDGFAGWSISPTGTGSAVDFTLAAARSGQIGIRLLTGDAIGNQSFVQRGAPTPTTGLLGLEASFSQVLNTGIVELRLLRSTGTNTYNWAVRYRRANNDIQVLQSDGTWATVIAITALPTVGFLWNGFKLVADLASLRYERVLFNRASASLTAYSAFDSGATAGDYVAYRVAHEASIAGNLTVYIDDVILTQGEPSN